MAIKLLIISLFISVASYAQIAASLPVAGTASTSNATSYAMTAFTPTANSLLVVFVGASGTVQSNPTMTGGSLTWTMRAQSLNIGGAGGSFYIFWAKVGASPVSTTITFDCTGDAGTGANESVVQFTGHDATTSDPIKQHKFSAVTTSTNAAITYDAALGTSNGYASGWIGGLGANASTPPTGWTEADDLSYTTPAANMATAYRAGGVTTAGPFTFTNASTSWMTSGVEVYVSGAGPTSTHKKGSMHNAF